MNTEHDLIRLLYDDDAPSDLQSRLIDDPTLAATYRNYQALKKGLDARPRVAPDQTVVQKVLDAATLTDVRSRKPDRAPIAHRFNRLRMTVTMAMVMILAAVGTWQLTLKRSTPEFAPAVTQQQVVAKAPAVQPESSREQAPAVVESPVPASDSRNDQRMALAAAERAKPQPSKEEEAPASEAETEDLPVEEWDVPSDVQLIQRRIESLQGQGTGWDQPVVPAGSISSGSILPANAPGH